MISLTATYMVEATNVKKTNVTTVFELRIFFIVVNLL